MNSIEFSSMDVFDLNFYNGYELLFKMNKVKAVSLSNVGDYKMRLSIEDAVINMDILDCVTNGTLNSKEISIFGYSVWRNIDDGLDYEVRLSIGIAEFENYKLNVLSGDVAKVSMSFVFFKSEEGNENIKIGILNREGE